MSKVILQILTLVLVGVTLFAQQAVIKPIDLVESKKKSTVFEEVNLFTLTANRQGIILPTELADASILNLDKTNLSAMRSSQSQTITLSLPVEGRSDIVLDLVEVDIFAAGFKVYEAPVMNYIKYQNGKHYRGVVQGAQTSAVAISIFDDQVMGLITSNRIQGNLVLGKLVRRVSR